MSQKHSISTHLSPEYVLLGFLAISPFHGYEIHQRLERELKHIWRLSLSQVYNVLSRLAKEGLIDGELKPQENRPDRTLFQLTPSGREHFETWLNSPIGPSVHALRMAFITKLYFSAQLADGQLSNRVRTQEAEIRRGLEKLKGELNALPEEQNFNRLSLKLRTSQLESLLDWLQDCRSALKVPF